MKKLRIALPFIGIAWMFMRSNDVQEFLSFLVVLAKVAAVCTLVVILKGFYDFVASHWKESKESQDG